jgi:phosphoglycolate phosphatase-like HAD superfamily hydrolase
MSTREPGSRLPSWRPGATRDAVLHFLDEAAAVPVAHRVACFDNDGTLWCERPTYVQLDFFLDVLRQRVARDPGVARGEEFAALLSGDRAAVDALGLPRIGSALTGLCAGISPEEFTSLVRDFMGRARHAGLDRPTRATTYQPMLELLDELRSLDFTISVVTGGGTEFVRAVSDDLYGVPPELVVGTLLQYDVDDPDGSPSLVRSTRLFGEVNEGAAKVGNIQTQLGRRPILGVGNSAGDRQMLAWATGGVGPSLALLVEHDDAEREFSYAGKAETFAETEPITDVARRLGWTVVSMAQDWETVFAPLG